MPRPRSQLGTFRKLIGDAAQPVWLIDHQRNVAYVNAAAEQWLGIDGDAIVGQRCNYSWTSDSDPVPPTASLAPPPEVFERGEPAEAIVVAGGELGGARRRVRFLPLVDGARNVTAVLAIAELNDAPPGEAPYRAGVEAAELHQQLGLLRQQLGQLYSIDQLVGSSAAIERVRSQIRLAAREKTRVLIEGEPGSGREHVARAIYYHQAKRGVGTLVPLSCRLLDTELLQSTIAGFIHAQPDFEVEGPVCFLLLDADELSAEAQTSLMAVLNIVELKAHTLTTAATSLTRLAEEGKYRPDLAHYLSTLVIQMPPLRERREDIPLVAQKMLEDVNAAGGPQFSGFRAEAMDQLVMYPWRGNFDELRTVIQQAARRATSPLIGPNDLPDALHHAARAAAHQRRAPEPIVLDQYLERIEAELIRRALKRSKGNRARAARLLGISRARLLRRIEQLGDAIRDT